MQCPNCLKENPANSQFCQQCGVRMEAVAVKTETMPAAIKPPSEGTYSQPPAISVPQSPAQSHTPLPHRPTYAGQQMGTGGTSAANIWGPFAGYGERGRHVSWLLDNRGEQTEALHEAISERFRQRQIERANMRWMQLTGQGIVVERRPFFFIQRGITTVALYIGKFGKDLYISQVTYAKGPINNLRVAILGLMLLFHVFFVFGYGSSVMSAANSLSAFGASSGLGSLFALLCVVGPLGFINALLLLLAFIFSVYKWLKEKDFWAILRTPPNEFQMDDIVALEKSVEQTVRESLDKVNIPQELMPERPSSSFGMRVI